MRRDQRASLIPKMKRRSQDQGGDRFSIRTMTLVSRGTAAASKMDNHLEQVIGMKDWLEGEGYSRTLMLNEILT